MNRTKIINELKVRQAIRKMLEGGDNKAENITEEIKFRNFVKSVLSDSELREAKIKVIPYDSTGIAVLADVIKKVIPIVKDDYFSLTTDLRQRRSFRAHIINGVRNSLAPLRNFQGYPTDGNGDASQLLATPGEEDDSFSGQQTQQGGVTEPLAEVDGEDERFIDVGDKKPSSKVRSSEEEDDFTVAGEDGTGRNLALSTFKRVERTIIDGYQILDFKSDQEDFYDYIIANFKLYFDRWEEELQKTLQEK